MKRLGALWAVYVLLLPLAARAQSEEGYDSRSYARLSYVSGEVNVQRTGDMGYEAGTINLALIEGDKLAIREGRAEVSLGRQNFIRLDRLSQLEFANLPRDGYEPYKIYLMNGRLYLKISRMDQDKEFELHTPDASFYILETGLYRFEVAEKGETRLFVLEGRLESAGQTGSLEVGSGQSLVAKNGNLMSRMDNLYAEADDFSRWNQSRDSLLASRGSGSYLPQELGEYDSELNEYGDWHYEADDGYVWVPQVSYYPDWHPYYYGRWVWYPIIGWTWVPDEPWGWCVYHYGRWHWRYGLGWYWMPTRRWGPAWVHWFWHNDYLGWCPLNRWNRPVVVINNIFYPNYGNTYHSIHNRALTVISRNQLQARRISDVALRGAALTRIGRVSLSGRQPSLSPSMLRSGRLADQARRTFEQSAGRPVQRTYPGGFSGRLSRSIQERSPLRSLSSDRSASGREGSISRRLSGYDRGGSSGHQTEISSRRIREFSPGRSSSALTHNRLSSTSGSRSPRSTSNSSLPEFQSRLSSSRSASSGSSLQRRTSVRNPSRNDSAVSTRRSIPSREYSSRLSSANRSGASSSQRYQSSSGRSYSSSGRFSSRSSASPSVQRSTSRYSNWRSSSPSGQSSSFSNRGSSSSRSLSLPSRRYSSSSRSYAAPSRSSSSPSRSSSATRRSFSSSSRASSSSGRSGSSHSSASRSSSSSSHVRHRNR
jgi:hypothetical protein